MTSWQPQTFTLLAVMIIALVSQACAAANSGAGPTAKKGAQQTSMDGTASPGPPSKQALCPEAGVPAPNRSSISGRHGVTLRWSASALSAHSKDNPVGYCLYRTKKRGLAKMAMSIPNAHCGGCEQVNRVPIAGTGCVDDLVEDNTTYYYVVTAITSAGLTSSSSDEAIAEVPRHKQVSSVPSAYPSCSTPGLSK